MRKIASKTLLLCFGHPYRRLRLRPTRSQRNKKIRVRVPFPSSLFLLPSICFAHPSAPPCRLHLLRCAAAQYASFTPSRASLCPVTFLSFTVSSVFDAQTIKPGGRCFVVAVEQCQRNLVGCRWQFKSGGVTKCPGIRCIGLWKKIRAAGVYCIGRLPKPRACAAAHARPGAPWPPHPSEKAILGISGAARRATSCSTRLT